MCFNSFRVSEGLDDGLLDDVNRTCEFERSLAFREMDGALVLSTAPEWGCPE